MIAQRTTDEITADIGTRLPDGWAWDHGSGSNTMLSFAPLADSIATFEAAAIALLSESEPDSAVEMLTDYERVLGPDTCIGDPATLTFSQRQAAAHARWIGVGGASIPALIALAASYGVTITITELRRNCAGVLKAGRPVRCHPQQFTFVIGLPTATVTKFRAGASKAGESIGKIQRSDVIECVIRRAAPAHTVPVFNYAGPSLPAPLGQFGLGRNSLTADL